MAVNKNFIVRNGLEVDESLIFADADTQKVGIGTTTPECELTVAGKLCADTAEFTGIVTASGFFQGAVSGTDIIANNLNVSGISTLNNVEINGLLTAGGTTGQEFYYLANTGAGVTWKSFQESVITSVTVTAFEGQDLFTVDYEVGLIEVYLNGVRLTDSEFSALNGSTVTLIDPTFEGDTVDFVRYSNAFDFFQLGDINVNTTGIITASQFYGDLTGNADTATTLQNARNFSISGDVEASSVSFNGSSNVSLQSILSSSFSANTTGIVTAFKFFGDGSGLTNISAVGTGISVYEDDTFRGVVGNINFGNLDVSEVSSGIVTITTPSTIIADLTGTATTATNLSNAANITTGTISSDRLTGSYDIDITGTATTATNLSDAANITTGTISASRLTGSYDIDITGTATTATNLSDAANITTGTISSDRLTGSYDIDITGTATTAGTATTSTNASFIQVGSTNDDFTFYPVFVDGTSGFRAPEVDSDLTYNPSTNTLTANFVGDGSGLTGVTAEGTGIVVKDNDTPVGTAGTINFATNLSLSAVASGIVTVSIDNPIVSDLSGNASTATTATGATNIDIDATSSTDTTTYPVLVGNNATGNQTPFIDNAGLSYNASTNTLNANFSGDGSGLTNVDADTATSATNATNATNASNIGIALTNTDATYYPVFVDATSGFQAPEVDSDLTYNPFTNTLSANFRGNLVLNSNDITGTGDVNITGIITATTFSGSGASLNSIPNGALDNSTVSYGGIQLSLGGSDATPAFDLSDATNYPYTSLTGITTEIVGDTTPQLGGNLDLNSNNITGTGNVNLTGIVTATGGFNIGIQSAGVEQTTGVVTAINFTGAGTTVTYDAANDVATVSSGIVAFGSINADGTVEVVSGINTVNKIGTGQYRLFFTSGLSTAFYSSNATLYGTSNLVRTQNRTTTYFEVAVSSTISSFSGVDAAFSFSVFL